MTTVTRTIKGTEVEIERVLALAVRGQDVSLEQAVVGPVAAGGNVEIRMGGCGPVIAGGSVEIERGGCGPVLTGGDFTVRQGGCGPVMAAGNATLDHGFALAVIGGSVSIDAGSRVFISVTGAALAVTGAAAAVGFLLGRLLGRRG
jgi:hypothetical protein